MLAASYLGGGELRVVEQPVPPLQEGEVQLSVAYTGICGTDLHILNGDLDGRVPAGTVIGHEMVGRVVDAADGVEAPPAGALVTVRPLRPCGRCAACRRRLDHICERLVVLGVDASGSMRSTWNVPAGIVIPLPGGLPPAEAALVEPATVAVHDVERSALSAGERAIVVGGGPVGVLIALVARWRGAEVVVLEPHPGRRSLAAGLGLRLLDPVAEDVAGFVEDWTGGEGVEVSFEASGHEDGIALALAALGPRGRLCLVGIHAAARRLDLYRMFARELTLVGARLYTRDEFDAAAGLLASGELPAAALVSAVVGLDGVAAAVGRLRRQEAMKILVDCSGDRT